ncbi:hypothetical protein RI129_012521 [Pyrocoelia pectoralis]|uniref:Uncharacterized protein n=1 Tax=Pyrocoelia pectoralis TaxID=417401 RepID=A0AAN7ZF00_9COLE
MEAKLFNNVNQRSKVTYKKPRNPMSTLDRLSVRTEVSPVQTVSQTASRKLVTLPNEETITTHEQLLYFSPNDDVSEPTSTKSESEISQDKNSPDSKSGPSSLHDTILATQLRHINRELTPTISEVYHERNLGLGLAPPLAKLLLNQNSSALPQTDNSVLEKITLGILEETELASDLAKSICQRCKIDSSVCMCKNKLSKPWLSETASSLQQIQSSDLTTADILEREVKNKKVLRDPRGKEDEAKRLSPFSEMSRRDEGDGRSIADSNCSSYKATQFRNFGNDTTKSMSLLRSAHAPIPSRRTKQT